MCSVNNKHSSATPGSQYLGSHFTTEEETQRSTQLEGTPKGDPKLWILGNLVGADLQK